jgi:gas vesicle protein
MTNINVKQAAGFLVAGAMLGAAVALLSAPQSGARTTRDLKKFARNTADRLHDLQGDLRGHVADWVQDMTEVVKEDVNRGRELGAEGYGQVLQGFDNAKKWVDDGRSRIEQLITSV